MASIAFEEYKNKLNNLRPALDDLGGALHLDEARNEVEKLEEESAQDGFWNDTENSQRVQKRIKTLKHKLERYAKLTGAWEDMLTMCEMAVEEDDDSMLPDLESEFQSFEETLERHPHLPRRRRRHRGAGLDEHALPYVQHVGRAPRLHRQAHGLSRRRRGRHQERDHHDRGRERLRLPQERERHPPSRAHQPV